MDGPGIKAMQTTAKAFMQLVKQVQTQAAMANASGQLQHQAETCGGGSSSIFHPPTADEAEAAKRKAKHMLWFRGPAVIAEVMSPTTFTLRYKGREYKRCLSELRPFKVKSSPDLDMGVAADSASSFKIGTCVAYSDTDDPKDPASSRFHLGKCINIADGMAHVHCYATHGNALSRCAGGYYTKMLLGYMRLATASMATRSSTRFQWVMTARATCTTTTSGLAKMANWRRRPDGSWLR